MVVSLGVPIFGVFTVKDFHRKQSWPVSVLLQKKETRKLINI